MTHASHLLLLGGITLGPILEQTFREMKARSYFAGLTTCAAELQEYECSSNPYTERP